MKKRIIFLFCALVLLGAGCIKIAPRVVRAPGQQGVTVAQKPTAVTDETADELQPIAILALDGGTAALTRAEKIFPVQDGLELLAGDTIEVTMGTVMLVYPEAGASYLDEGSKVTLLPDGEGEESVFAQIEVAAGSIWTRFERLLGSDERFSVIGNGVVATVRGTAFGFELTDDGAEVQVAESEVDVSSLENRRDKVLAVRLKAGEGLITKAAELKKADPAALKARIRQLNEQEKARAVFLRVKQKIQAEILKRRIERVRLEEKPLIPKALEDRLTPEQLERLRKLKMLQEAQGFTAPVRSVLPNEIAPNAVQPLRLLAPTSTTSTR
ncbi:FecR domain-containing protein [Patescibacteria group bacterium]|nr:FecR domain-containing protein [Patescibacteria group bacterium]MBU1034641.1 FecR domain-containing protein [Patescibacteria group bacterium]MBU1908301.1 FecR domain-containing protein [Patescibacteria group bacterium]